MKAELANLDATEQAELVRRKEVSPLELVDAAINRLKESIRNLTPLSLYCLTRRGRRRGRHPATRFPTVLSGESRSC